MADHLQSGDRRRLVTQSGLGHGLINRVASGDVRSQVHTGQP